MSAQTDIHRVVVGLDGSAHSQAALHWAAMEAAARDVDLVVVTACRDGDAGKVGWQRRFIDALSSQPVRLRQLVVREPAADALIRIAGHGVLVVGAASRGRVGSFVLGSVAFACSQEALGPVVVVRDGMAAVDTPSGAALPVVAAVNDSACAVQALRFAGEESRLHDWPLLAVHVLYRDYLIEEQATDSRHVRDGNLLDTGESAWVQLKAAISSGLPGDVTAVPTVLVGDPVQELIARSAGAALVTVGRSGAGHRMDAMLGSVRTGLLQHAQCPVAVVPETACNP